MKTEELKLIEIIEELKEFENFAVEKPTEKDAVHVKYVIKTADPQSVIKSLELLKQKPETIFWVIDDCSVALGQVNS